MKNIIKINIQKLQFILLFCIVIITFFGCGKKEIEYGSEIGVASGSVDLSGDEPDIKISNIRSYIGEDIDYLSGINVNDIDKYDEMEIWVDASLVDIFTAGDYKATYTFKYGDKEYTREIVVTIIERENAGDSVDNSDTYNGEENNYQNNGNGSGDNNSDPDNTGANNNSGGNTNNGEANNNTGGSINNGGVNNNAGESTNNSGANNNVTGNTNSNDNTVQNPNGSGITPATTSKNNNQTTAKPQNNNQTTTHRQIITSAGTATTSFRELGYYSIELLSGKIVKLKSTTSKYIVSTRTDVSYTTKNNANYKVSKLIVTFSDGTTQVLETVEEKQN